MENTWIRCSKCRLIVLQAANEALSQCSYCGTVNKTSATTPMEEQCYKAIRNFEKLANWAIWIALLVGFAAAIAIDFSVALILFTVLWLGLKLFTRLKIKGILKRARNIRREQVAAYSRKSSIQIKTILRQAAGRPIARKIEKLYYLIHSSPDKSDSSLQALEEEITGSLDLLNNAIHEDDMQQVDVLADKVYQLVEERNEQLKQLNQ
ncbi:MAG: hypothetical protein LBR81_05730 [Prevotellaceae bacterium]|jgi:phage FluMu protein Com|nr:hypothetical protein [Prevotellaceae bacterium]